MDRKTKLIETTRYLFDCKYDAPDFDDDTYEHSDAAKDLITVLKLASERCVAADEICVKGVRGCFPDKRFISSCFGRGL